MTVANLTPAPGAGMEPPPTVPPVELGPDALVDLVSSRDLILVTGKGGVGKSTVVAALAGLAAKLRGSAVAAEIAAHPRLAPMMSDDSIDAVNIDIERAASAALGRLLRMPRIVSRLLNNRIIRLFIRTSPALKEMVFLDEIRSLVADNAPAGRPVIVDLPASGHAVSFLDTPRVIKRMLRVGPVARVAGEIEELFLDGRRCELVVVALPEELPVNETIELVQRASEMGLASRTIVVNQVPAPPVDDHDRGLLDVIARDADEALGHFVGAARDELASVDEARAQVTRLRRALRDPVIELPLLATDDPQQRVDSMVQSIAT